MYLAIAVIVLALVNFGTLAGLGHLARRLRVAEYRGRLLAIRTSGTKALGERLDTHALQLTEQRKGLETAARMFGQQAEQNVVFHDRLLALEEIRDTTALRLRKTAH